VAFTGVANGQESGAAAAVVLGVQQMGQAPEVLRGKSLPLLQLIPAAEASAVESEFWAGYRDGGGAAELEERFAAVVWCESRWLPWTVSKAGYLGLAQFSPGTWATVAKRTGYWDWWEPYHQGMNVAMLSRMADPASQWSCW